MKREVKEKHFLKKPEYPGGPRAMHKFLADNQQYPDSALENRIEGTVTVRYTIDYLGKVIQTRVIAGIGHGCDEEAERMVSLLKFEVPKTRKMKVQFQKTIHIHFKLPKKKEISTSVSYTLKPAKEEKSSSKPKTYEYRINW